MAVRGTTFAETFLSGRVLYKLVLPESPPLERGRRKTGGCVSGGWFASAAQQVGRKGEKALEHDCRALARLILKESAQLALSFHSPQHPWPPASTEVG